MALLADGWHMSSHALAPASRRSPIVQPDAFANDGRFCFRHLENRNTGRLHQRHPAHRRRRLPRCFIRSNDQHPMPIRYDQAIAIAIIGLVVPASSARGCSTTDMRTITDTNTTTVRTNMT